MKVAVDEKTYEVGSVWPPQKTIQRQVVFESTTDDHTGDGYECSVTPGMCPAVRSNTTGKWFILSWSDIIVLARASGIEVEEDAVGDAGNVRP
jgi:hypothetical protein